ncbi:MAG: hypothetical protein AAGD14_12405 [Planctomycetota bacterium]
MKDFLLGIFTDNIVTKLVSLLLAIVLFVFTQQSISETQIIEKLTIEFELSREVDRNWVLTRESVELRDIRVTGLREILTREIAGLRAAGFRKKLLIDDAFLVRHDPEQGVVLDAAFCRAEDIPWELARDFELKMADQIVKLPLERRLNLTLTPRLRADQREKLILPADSDFQWPNNEPGELVWPDELASISISGPKSSLPENLPDKLEIYVEIEPLALLLRDATTLEEANGSFPIKSIDWDGAGINIRRGVRIEQPAMKVDTLQEVLTFRCNLEPRRSTVEVSLQLRFFNPDAGPAPLEEYVLRGLIGAKSTVLNHDEDWSQVKHFPLEVPRSLEGREEEIESKVQLVLDFANAEVRDNTLLVRLSLTVDPTLPEGVRIATDDDPGTTLGLRFDKKPE